MYDPRAISVFARTNGRHPHRVFGIRQVDRLGHLYVIGRTGSGKSTLIETLIHEDIRSGRGCALIDPHGDLARRVYDAAKRLGRTDVVYWDVADIHTPYGYNPLKRVRKDFIPLAASGLLEAMEKLWGNAWGVRMEHVLRNALYALLEYGEATLPDVLTILIDRPFRREVLRSVQNAQVKTYWEEEYPKLSPMYRKDAIAPIQNKIGAFLADPRLYRILTDTPEELSMRKIMDTGSVFIVNLAKGRLGEDSASLLGALLMTTMSVAAMSRASMSEEKRVPFFLFVDEFQSFTTLSVSNMISELRKYKVGLTLAHQHLHQLEPDVQHSVLGNVGTMIAFRVGPEDAPLISRELAPTFAPLDLMNLGRHEVLMRLMIDGVISPPFSATTIAPDAIARLAA
jgi:energy-coupling factor transporter ATP-binding protein EcfA2